MLYFSPVPLFLTSTLAPGITPPDVSTTVPFRDVKKLPCASARGAKERTSDAASSIQVNRTLIETLPREIPTCKLDFVGTVIRRKPQRQREKAKNKDVIAEP